jgi:ABC-type antimicrobial peptide transport system permease subunit
VWLAVDGAQHEAVVAALQAGVGPVGTAVLDDAQARQAAMQADLIAAETIGAFQLNGWTLGLLSVIIFLLVNFFAMRKRMYEFGVLRASGLARRQLLGLLSLEGVLLLLLGLSAGTLTGWGLAVLMRPFLSRVLATAVGGDAIQQILVNWGELLRVYGVLIGAYVLALTLLLLALGGAGIYRAVRIGDE